MNSCGGAPVRELPRRDLDHVLDHTRHIWPEFRDGRVFITGGTGFVGSWMLETLLYAERTLKLGVRVTVLARARDTFASRFPHLADAPGLCLHVGDVRVVDPPTHAFTHFVHCASAATPRMNAERPEEVLDLIENGSRRMVEAAEAEKGSRFLQMSSGSVYGPQPTSVSNIPESFTGEADPADPAQRFGAAKLVAERRGALAVEKGVRFVSARAFGLVGPRLPLDGPFAIGNFLGDALAGRMADIHGDGTPVRSWMHAADLAAWCWTLLARGTPGSAYNVGSEEPLAIAEAAAQVAALAVPPVPVVRRRNPVQGVVASRYVPDVTRAREELGLDVWIPFDAAIRRTWEWLRQ